MGIHDLVDLFPKSLVVIAGEPNAGKTAFCLNVARLNMERHKVTYFSSEMWGAELKVRLLNFNQPLESWLPVRFKGGMPNFQRDIDPTGINIIDYLEVYKDFYEIGGLMNEVYNSLTMGVAVVAIQKPPGRDTGVGGQRTLDKARLYLSIAPNQLKIVKAKIWAEHAANPNGRRIEFLLGGGCNFKTTNTWMY